MLEAFAAYLKMGADRSLAKVGRRFGKSKRWAEAICKRWNWVARVEEIERKNAETEVERAKRELAESKERKLKIIKAIDARFAQRLQSDKVKITVHEFERAGRFEMLLRGEADQHVQVDQDFASLVEDADADPGTKEEDPAGQP